MITITKEKLKLFNGEGDITFLVIESNRIDDCIKYLFNHKLKNIMISNYHGYKLNHFKFIEKISDWIEGVLILDTDYDYSHLNLISNLKKLNVQDNKSNTIDLSKFPKLKICNISFSKRLIGLDLCTTLEDLSINNYKFLK